MDYKVLVKKRGIIKGSITKLRNYIDSFVVESSDYDLLKIKFNKILQYEKSFYDIQSELELHEQASTEDLEDRETYDDIFDNIKLKYQKLSQLFEKSNIDCCESTKTNQILLKPIEIEPYCGDVKAWPKFIDLFTNLVHNRKDFSEIEKFYCLNGFLKGLSLIHI